MRRAIWFLWVFSTTTAVWGSQLSQITCLKMIEQAGRMTPVKFVSFPENIWTLAESHSELLGILQSAQAVPESVVGIWQVRGRRAINRQLRSFEPRPTPFESSVTYLKDQVVFQFQNAWYHSGHWLGGVLWAGACETGAVLTRLAFSPLDDPMELVAATLPFAAVGACFLATCDQKEHHKINPVPRPPVYVTYPERWQERWQNALAGGLSEPRAMSWQGRVNGKLPSGQTLPRRIGFSLVLTPEERGPELWMVLIDQELAEREKQRRVSRTYRLEGASSESSGTSRQNRNRRRRPSQTSPSPAAAEPAAADAPSYIARFQDERLKHFYEQVAEAPHLAAHFAEVEGFHWQQGSARVLRHLQLLDSSATLEEVRQHVGRRAFAHYPADRRMPGSYGLMVDPQWTLFFERDNATGRFVIVGVAPLAN